MYTKMTGILLMYGTLAYLTIFSQASSSIVSEHLKISKKVLKSTDLNELTMA